MMNHPLFVILNVVKNLSRISPVQPHEMLRFAQHDIILIGSVM